MGKIFNGSFKRNLRTDHWERGAVQITVKGEEKTLFVWTKLKRDNFGRNLPAYAERWVKTTKEFTDRSLVDFINTIELGYAFTEEDFETYRKKVKDIK